MRSSDLFAVRMLLLAGRAQGVSTPTSTTGKPRRISTGFFSLSKGAGTIDKESQPGIIPGMTGEPILRKNKYRLFLSARSTWALENSIQIIKIIHTKEGK